MSTKKDDSSSSHDEKQDPEVGGGVPILASADAKGSELDIALVLPGITGVHEDHLDPKESRRVKAKLDKRIVPLLMTIYTLQFLDKNIIANSSILGFLPDNGLTIAHLNNLGTFFYVGVLLGQLPHAYALQRLPVAKYLSAMMFIWALLVGMHCVAGNYRNLIALRILLGLAEGCITPGVMLICSMFYTRMEMGERVGWTFQCNGLALIISGFLSFGAYHAPAKKPGNGVKVAQWQWFMLIVALLTFVCAIIFLIIFPDNITSAKFLTEEEKVTVVKRMRENQTGSETKKWKWYQFKEALLDPKGYMFLFYAAIANFVGGIGIQFSLIIKDFGFSILETTLLQIPSGAGMIICVTVSMYLLHLWPNARGWISLLSYIPSVIAGALLIGLPNGRIGLLLAFYLLQFGNTPAVVLSLSWITTTTSGHTKKVVLHGMWFVGYSIGQMVSPQWWKDKYKPRNRVPWIIILTSYCVQVFVIIGMRYYFKRMNEIRDAAAEQATGEEAEKYGEYGYIEVPDSSAPGGTKRVQVEKRFLDLTDKENLNFRYVL